jgi:hypothetical protein
MDQATDPVAQHIPARVRESVLVANLTQQGFAGSIVGSGATDPGTGEPLPGFELQVNGRMMPEAQWPDDPVVPGHSCTDSRYEPYACAGYGRVSPDQKWRWNGITVSPESLALNASYFLKQRASFGPNASTLLARGFFGYDWAVADCPVDSVFPTNRSLLCQKPWYSLGYWGGSRYWLTGLPEALSAPGEFFVDAPRGMLYTLPPPNRPQTPQMSGAEGTLATEVLAIARSARVRVSGLTLSGSRGTLMSLANVSDVQVTGCNLWGSGVAAINAHFDANRNVRLANNTVLDTATFSLWIAGGNRTTLEPSGSEISGNVVQRYGRTHLVSSPAVSADGVGHVIASNTMTTGPNCALMFSGNDITMEHNLITDAVRSTLDAGAICTGPRDWTATNWTIRGNALLSIGPTAFAGNIASDPLRTGIYFDRGSFGGLIEKNVFVMPTPPIPDVNTSRYPKYRAVYIHGGRNTTVVNNAAFGVNFTENNPVGLLGDKLMETNGSIYYTELVEAGWRRAPYADRYPQLALLDDFYSPRCSETPSCGPAPWNNTIARNIAVNGTEFFVPMPAASNFSDGNFAIHSNLVNPVLATVFASPDPASTLNLTFVPGGAAQAQGIQPLPRTFGSHISMAPWLV